MRTPKHEVNSYAGLYGRWRDQVTLGGKQDQNSVHLFGDKVLQFRFINETHLLYGDYPLSALLHPLACCKTHLVARSSGHTAHFTKAVINYTTS